VSPQKKKKWPEKAFNYRMHPDNLMSLKEARIDYCSLANNHTLDFGVAGMLETVKSLNHWKIHWAGVGHNLAEAQRPSIFTRKGKKFACFSFADHYDFWAAEEEKPGINYFDADNHTLEALLAMKKRIEYTKILDNPDIIVVSCHWGPNYCWHPSEEKQRFAHELIDAGVDIIHGHSSHHVQGIEIYKGKPIVYGCGDFVDDYATSTEYRNDLGFAYFIDWNFDTKTANQIELLPTKIDKFSVNKMTDPIDRKWLTDTMRLLCSKFGTDLHVQSNGNILIPVKSPTSKGSTSPMKETPISQTAV